MNQDTSNTQLPTKEEVEEKVEEAKPEQPEYLPRDKEKPMDYIKRQMVIRDSCQLRIDEIRRMFFVLKKEETVDNDDTIFVTLIQYKRANELMKYEASQRINSVQELLKSSMVMDSIEDTTFKNWVDQIEWDLWDPLNRKGGYYEVTLKGDEEISRSDIKFDDGKRFDQNNFDDN